MIKKDKKRIKRGKKKCLTNCEAFVMLLTTELARKLIWGYIMQSNVFVHLPLELSSQDPLLLKIYLILVRIAHDNNGREIYLPSRNERAKLYGVNHTRALALENELQSLNLIRLQTEGGKGFKNARRRIIIKYQITVNTATELVEPKRTFAFPDDLHRLKISCRNRDVQRQTLADFSDQELYILSGGASNEDIRQAIIEVENFRPSSRAPIYSIKKVFAQRFIDGKLSEKRKGRMNVAPPPEQPVEQTPATPPEYAIKLRNYALAANEIGANLFPDAIFDESGIETLVDLINSGVLVKINLKPASLLRLMDRNPDAFYVDGSDFMLRTGYKFEKIHPGYYKLSMYQAAL